MPNSREGNLWPFPWDLHIDEVFCKVIETIAHILINYPQIKIDILGIIIPTWQVLKTEAGTVPAFFL